MTAPESARDGIAVAGIGLTVASTVGLVALVGLVVVIVGHHAEPGLWAHICGRPFQLR